MRNFRKCVKTLLNACFSNQHSEEFLCRFLLKSGITKKCLWWRVVVSCISHANGKVLPRNFLWMSFFKHIETTAYEITKKQPVIFNTVAVCVYPIDSFQTFHACYYCLQSSSLSQSSSVLIFAGIKWECYSISVGRVMLIVLSLERGIFVNHEISAVTINRYYKLLLKTVFTINVWPR